jgi:hypothetical protein
MLMFVARQVLEIESTANALSGMGALKLQLQRPEDEIDPGLRRLMATDLNSLKALWRGMMIDRRVAQAGSSLTSMADERGLLRGDRVMNFRWALSTLRTFDARDTLVRKELKDLSTRWLVGHPTAPIAVEAKDFPLDNVGISQRGVLTFSGQAMPVQIWGPRTSHFIPTPVVRTTRRRSDGAGAGGGATAPAIYTLWASGLGTPTAYPQLLSSTDAPRAYSLDMSGDGYAFVNHSNNAFRRFNPALCDAYDVLLDPLGVSIGAGLSPIVAGASRNVAYILNYQSSGLSKRWEASAPGAASGTLTDFETTLKLAAGQFSDPRDTLYAAARRRATRSA